MCVCFGLSRTKGKPSGIVHKVSVWRDVGGGGGGRKCRAGRSRHVEPSQFVFFHQVCGSRRLSAFVAGRLRRPSRT